MTNKTSSTYRKRGIVRALAAPALVLAAAAALGGCVYAPPYGYAPAPAYSAYPAYGYAYGPAYYPSVSLGVGFGGGGYGHWHGH